MNCSNLTDISGNKCTFITGANCAVRNCTDNIISPSSTNCNTYLSTCLFNGTSCISPQADCATYTPTGATDAAKAVICNNLLNTSGAKCTYITGSLNCTNTMACTEYILPKGS